MANERAELKKRMEEYMEKNKVELEFFNHYNSPTTTTACQAVWRSQKSLYIPYSSLLSSVKNATGLHAPPLSLDHWTWLRNFLHATYFRNGPNNGGYEAVLPKSFECCNRMEREFQKKELNKANLPARAATVPKGVMPIAV